MTKILLEHLFDCTEHGGSLVAEGSDGTLRHIDDVPSGLTCECVCLDCGRKMVARKGKIRTHCFAHHVDQDANNCTSTGETALHKYAKTVLERELKLLLPTRVVFQEGDSEVVVERHERSFDGVKLESRTADIVPDVILELRGHQLIVEFKVTHACGDEKIARLRSMNIGAIEIDLSGYRNFPLEDLDDAILFKAPRDWLHNPRDREAYKRLEARKKQEEVSLERRLEIFRQAYRHIRPSKSPGTGHYEVWARRCGLGDAINIPVNGAGCFMVQLAEWQAAAIIDLFACGKHHYRTQDALSELKYRGWVHEGFLDAPPEITRALISSDIQYAHPVVALESYLKKLVGIGYLHFDLVTDVWSPTSKLSDRLRNDERLRERPELRLSRVQDVVTKQLEGLPENEISEFVLWDWLRKTLPEHNFSIMHAIQLNDSEWDPVIRKISSVRQAIRHNPDPNLPLYGLPLQGELNRSRERIFRGSGC